MMDHIFISYSRKDEEAVNAFTDILRAEGIAIWQDNSGTANGIPFSTRWMEAIEQAIYMAGGALIFVSDNWKASVPCNKEMDIIAKCDIPYLEVMPDKAADDPQHYLELVKKFCDEKVLTMDNRRRTELFYNAGEYRSGMDPNHLIKSTRGIAGAIDYLKTDIRAYNNMMSERGYADLNPEVYPYMEKFVSFARRTASYRIAARIIGTVTAALIIAIAVFTWHFMPDILSIQKEKQRVVNIVNAAVVKFSDMQRKDPVHWIEGFEFISESISMEDAADLFENDMLKPWVQIAVGAEDIRLPLAVMDKYDERYDAILSAEPVKESDYYGAELSPRTGSVYVTDRSTGTRRTVSAGSAPECFAWSPDGRVLAFSSGSDLYVYDAAGHGSPFRLSENFRRIEQIKFIETGDEGRCVAAVTSGDRIVLWKDPLAYTGGDVGAGPADDVSKERIKYGIFCDREDPAAIYVADDTVVFQTAEKKYTGRLEAEGVDIFALSHDESKLAYVSDTGETWEIIVADISGIDKKVGAATILRAKVEHEPTDIAFSGDDSSIYAAVKGRALLSVDIATGEVRYSDQTFGCSTISSWGDDWVLTTYASSCFVFSSDMEVISDSIDTEDYGTPYFDTLVDESHGYFFTVNRGGGSPTGCSRIDLGSKDKSQFKFDPDERVASSTAIAVSKDEEYVAFGYPDGSVRIFETVSMQQTEKKKCLGESISALRFSDDGSTLYMLGSTGSIYSTPLNKYLLNNSTANMMSNCFRGLDQLGEKKQQYFDGLKLRADM